jgi:hypothetical protein
MYSKQKEKRSSLTRKKVETIKYLLAECDNSAKIARTTSLLKITVYEVEQKLEKICGNVDKTVQTLKKQVLKQTPTPFLQIIGKCLQNDPFFTQNGIKKN